MPRGSSLVIAIGGSEMSLPTRVDTARGSGDRVALFVAPCQRFADTLRKVTVEPRVGDRDREVKKPAVGAAIELAGHILGTTDASGHYEV